MFAFLAAIISGVSIFLNKFAVTAIPQPLLFTTLKNTGVAVFIISLLLASRKWQQIRHVTKKQALQLILIGLVGGSIPFFLFFTGLSQIPAVNGAIIHKSLVIWVSVLAIPFLKEKLSAKKIAAVFSLFLANAFIGGFSGFSFSLGELMVLAATLFWAVETILAKKVLATVDPDIVTAFRMGIGSLTLIVISLITNYQSLTTVQFLTANQWAWIGITSILLLFYVSIWYRALKYAPATSVTAVLVLSTIITNLLSAVFITGQISPSFLIQSLLILSITKILLKTQLPAPVLSNSSN